MSTAGVADSPEDGAATARRPGSHPLARIAKARDAAEAEWVRQCLLAAESACYRWTVASDRIEWSANAREVLGGASEETIASARGYAMLVDTDNLTNRYETVVRSTRIDDGSGVDFAIEYRFRPLGRDKTAEIWIEDCGRWYAGVDGRPAEVYGVVRQLDPSRVRDVRSARPGYRDDSTGLLNRAGIVESVDEIDLARRDGDKPTGLVVAEIANIDDIADAYGHAAVESVVALTAERLKLVLRGGDLIGRIDTRKFAIVLAGCDGEDLAVAATRFIAAVRDSAVETPLGPVWVRLLAGGALVPQDALSGEDAIARAEEAVTQSRVEHGGLFCDAASIRKAATPDVNIRCARELVGSLKADRFVLWHQPVVAADTLQPAFHEGLLRVRAEDGEIIPAGHLLPIAVKLGLIRLVDQRVCELTLKIARACPDACLTMNLSFDTLTDPYAFGRITALLGEASDITGRVGIEISHRIVGRDRARMFRAMRHLKSLGCRLVLDNYGAGVIAPDAVDGFDIVKIDGSLCTGLAGRPADHAFAQAVIEFARRSGASVAGECIEDEPDAALLAGWGVSMFQGRLFAAPGPEPFGRYQTGPEAPQPEPAAAPAADAEAAEPAGSSALERALRDLERALGAGAEQEQG